MQRRDFLWTGLAGGALLAGDWRNTAAAENLDAAQQQRGFALEEITINDLQRGLRERMVTARTLTEQYLDRIKKVDQSGPGLNSVIEINPDALALADKLDTDRRQGRDYGPLHGVPVLIKDNIDTADAMMTTAGSLALVGAKTAQDAHIVGRLRAAGAVILGKTNLSEWANFRSSRSTSGWSGRGGLTKNPYVLDRNTSGSSSGSGAATSANLCAVSVGTETDGSIVSPSSINGLVGIKPTVGLVSRTGIIPISHTQDTAGPMTRTVADAALLLSALAGPDPADRATSGSAGRIPASYAQFLDAEGLRGARIGIARKLFGYHPEVDKLANAAIAVLKERGAVIVDNADAAATWQFGDAEIEVLLYEFKAGLNAYLSRLVSSTVRTLNDVIAFNERNREREMPYFGQELFERAAKKGPLTEKAYLAALAKCRQVARTQGIDAVMTKNRLDALFAPTDAPAWETDLVNGDHYIGGSSTPAAVAGYPSVTVPAGYVFGLPVGVSFFGRAYSEPTLIKLAYAYEQATKHRRPPTFAPHAP